MNEKRTLHDWANELPAEYRQKLIAKFLDCVPPVRSVTGLIRYALNAAQPDDRQPWELLLEIYVEEKTANYHVSYMTEEFLSTGLTVLAVDIYHAIDIVLARTGKSADQIIYAHSKDNVFRRDEPGPRRKWKASDFTK